MNYRILHLLIWFFCAGSLVMAQGYPDRHSTGLGDGWLSCQEAANPNPIRGNGHWIMYNLGHNYAMTTSTIWNFNTPERINSYNNESWSLLPLVGKTEDGLKEIIIDLSNDGITWTEHGRFTIPKAPASSFYQGVPGPDFTGKAARYVLVTALSNHGGDCYGLGEFKIQATVVINTDTKDLLSDAKIEVFPNPFSEVTTVSLDGFPSGDALISIKDLTGKSMKEMAINIGDKQEKIQISGATWPNGLYLLQLTQNEISKTVKLEILR